MSGHELTEKERKPGQFQSGAKAVEAGRKGGIASGRKKRAKKSLKQALLGVLEDEYTGTDGSVTDGYTLVMAGLFTRARRGDPKAVKLVAELTGEYKQIIEGEIQVSGKKKGNRPVVIQFVDTGDDGCSPDK